MSKDHVLFARNATGLVREISKRDAFFASFAWSEIPLGILTFTSAPYIFPGGDMVLAILIATVLSIFGALMYTLLTLAVTRSGADYVFTSRTLHPGLGFMMSFNLMIWYTFFLSIYANWVTTLALAPSLTVIGTVTANTALVSAAGIITQPLNVLAIGLFVLLIFAVLQVRGLRQALTVTTILFIVALAGIVLAMVLMAANTQASFVSDFNRLASYNNITSTAHAEGYSPSSSSPFTATLGIMPFIWLTTGFTIATSYYSGEIKSAKTNLFYSQVVVAIFAGILLAILAFLAVRDFGYNFIGSASYLSSVAPSKYPFSFPPYLYFFVSVLTSNPIILWILGITFLAGITAGIAPMYTLVSRTIFAWSFDRVIPTRFSSISDRFHTPVLAISIIGVIAAVELTVYTLTPFLSFVSGATLALIISLIIVAITAIIFPFRRKDLLRNTPADIRIGAIPLITVSGVISLAFFLMMGYFLLTNSLYGANTPVVLESIAATLIIPVVIYIISFYYHKARVVDLSLVMREIPPE